MATNKNNNTKNNRNNNLNTTGDNKITETSNNIISRNTLPKTNSKNVNEPSFLNSISDSIGDTVDSVKDTVGSTLSKTSNSIGSIRNSIKSTASNISETVSDKTGLDVSSGENSVLWTLLKVALFIIIFIVILYIIKYFYTNYENNITNAPMLLPGSKDAKHGLVVSQDPKNTNYIPILPSDGQEGIEFSYSFWIEIEDFNYKSGQWKHIFHKGNSSSYPNRAPGVWIHPNTNAIRVYMNTQDKILEYVDIDNIPTQKWLHIVIVLRNKNLDIYVNGYLKARKVLSSIPRQNSGDLWVNMFGGFEGYVSNIQYFNSAINFTTIQNILNTGPSSAACNDTGDIPPYLDNSWWFNSK